MFPEDSFELGGDRRFVRKLNRKQRDAVSLFLTVLILVLCAVIAYQGYQMIRYYTDLRANQALADRAADIFNKAAESKTAAPAATDAAMATESPITIVTKPPAATAAPEAADRGIQPGILALRDAFQNDDIIGYVSIEGTNVQYAVAQAKNNYVYLDEGLDKQPNAAGAIFMDSSNNPEITDYNTVLYGHNMKNGSMFHNLRYYSDKRFLETHNTIVFQTLYEETVWEIFSFYPTQTNFDYIQTVFNDQKDYESFLADIQLKSVVDTGITLTADDAVLTLSTCTNTADNMRYALHARLVEKR